jgi:hypothetical protein
MRRSLLVALLVAIVFSSIDLFAFSVSPEEDVTKARLLLGKNRWIQFHYFLQAGVQTARTWDSDATPAETDSDAYWSKDFFLKRSRLILNGQVAKNVFFFMQTDDLKAGASSSNDNEENNVTGENKMFTQDAYIQFKAYDALQLYVGLLTVPFARQNMQSAATTLGTDLNRLQIPFTGYSNEGRDTGLMLRGMLFSQHFEYRLGAFRGLDREVVAEDNIRNENDYPRIAGRIQFNVFDADSTEAENGYFYSGNYLGKRNVVAFGFGIDYQQDVYEQGDSYDDYFAWAFDLTIDYKVADGYAFPFQFGMIRANNSPSDDALDGKFWAYYVQTGFLILDTFQPFIKYSCKHDEINFFGSKESGTVSGGLNYFIRGHHANVKLEYSHPVESNKDEPEEKKGVLQFQIYL